MVTWWHRPFQSPDEYSPHLPRFGVGRLGSRLLVRPIAVSRGLDSPTLAHWFGWTVFLFKNFSFGSIPGKTTPYVLAMAMSNFVGSGM
jgi:hypothetical protein